MKVEYRLAPEHAAELNGDATRLGESSGGNLAAVVNPNFQRVKFVS